MQRFPLPSMLLVMLLASIGVVARAAQPLPQPKAQQDGPLHPPSESQKDSGSTSDKKAAGDKPSGNKSDDDSSSSSSSSSGVQQELQGDDKGQKYDPMPAEKDLEVGTYYMRKGSYDAAIARFQEAIEQKADYAKPRLLIAQIYEKKGEKVSAAKYYKEYLRVYPHAPDAKKIQEKIAKLSER